MRPLTDTDIGLGGHHARGLVLDKMKVRSSLEFLSHCVQGSLGLGGQNDLGGHVGQDQRIGVLIVAQRTGLVSVEVQGTEPDRSHLKGKSEDSPDTGGQGRGRKGQPAGLRRVSEVGLEDGSPERVGVDTRPLAQRELQLLDLRAHLVGGAHRAPWGRRGT